MDQFERQFENLDVQTEFVENAMGNQANLSTPADQVNDLVMQVAEEHNLEVAMELPGAGTSVPAGKNAEADMQQRLAQLTGK
jgi:charged multivesicular body protein 1